MNSERIVIKGNIMTNASKNILRMAMIDLSKAKMALNDFNFKEVNARIVMSYDKLCVLANAEEMNTITVE